MIKIGIKIEFWIKWIVVFFMDGILRNSHLKRFFWGVFISCCWLSNWTLVEPLYAKLRLIINYLINVRTTKLT